MKKKIENILKNPYFITGTIVVLVFFVVFLVKEIYPFGRNTIIYGDMHDQITAFYYHFYDIFHGDKSFLVNFTTSGGINFIGILAYYILSPVSFILLFLPRNDIYLAVGIIVFVKILIASLTSLYSIRYLFKKRLGSIISVVLALSYAFSGYNLWMWQITPWMDAMYLFPLVVVGLKKVMNLEKPTLYIITLSMSLICSFYVSSMSLILIFILSFIYLCVYIEKEKRKKVILSLGLSTIIAVGISAIILIPSFLQITASSRLSNHFFNMFNSKIGPLYDKSAQILPSSFLFSVTLLLLCTFKKNKKFLMWYVPSLVVLGLPYLIEPINKMIHFGTYAFFPCRYGYMLFYLLVLGAGYFFITQEDKKMKREKVLKIIGLLLLCLLVGATLYFTISKYEVLHEALYHLTITGNKKLYVIWFLLFLFSVGVYFVTYFSQYNQKVGCLVFIFTVFCNGFLFFGIDHMNASILKPYYVLEELESIYPEGEIFRLKNNVSSMVTNSGMVTNFHNLDHFTSLVNANNLKTLKQLGYQSVWTKTYSKNGTLFSDSLLGNRYYLTGRDAVDKWYVPYKNVENYHLYKFNYDISFGYFTKNIEFIEEEDTFTFQNRIYKALMETDKNLFEIYDTFEFQNVEEIIEDNVTYKIIDKDSYNYIKKEIKVKDEKVLYLNAFTSFSNTEDVKNYETMDVYVNNKLVKASYPMETNNGSLYLGTFEDEKVTIQIVLKKDITLSYLKIGAMDSSRFTKFLEEKKVDNKIKFNRNQVIVDIDSEEEGLFFIPVTYDDGYQVKVNGEDKKLEKVYGNYLGVELDSGENHITFTYLPKGFKLGAILSILSIVLGIVFIHYYERIISLNLISKIATGIYLLLYVVLVFFIYFVPLVCFFLSYFFYIK